MRTLKRNVLLLDSDDEVWIEYHGEPDENGLEPRPLKVLVTAHMIPMRDKDRPEIAVYTNDDQLTDVEYARFRDQETERSWPEIAVYANDNQLADVEHALGSALLDGPVSAVYFTYGVR